MKNSDGIVTYKDYGYIKYNMKAIMKKKRLTKSQIVKRTGLHHQIIERYMNDTIIRFDRDILAKLCYVLDCDLDEMICYVRPKKKQ